MFALVDSVGDSLPAAGRGRRRRAVRARGASSLACVPPQLPDVRHFPDARPVAAMLDAGGVLEDDALGTVAGCGRGVSGEKAAVCGVMAGAPR